MPQQCLVKLLLTLLVTWLSSTAASKSVDHSDLTVYVFSNLQHESSGDSLPPYPEGIELELTCQAAARPTYWYEKHPWDAYPDLVKDKFLSRSSNPVPGVLLNVFTIPHLKKKDNGRELWCAMDSSSIKSVVNLTVVGPPSPPIIEYHEKGDGLELKCSSSSVDHHLELCWFRDDERLQCKFLGEDESPPTNVTMLIAVDDLLNEVTLTCKARFKEERVLKTLTKKTLEHFAAMLDWASVKLEIVGKELAPCHEEKPRDKSPSFETSTPLDADNNLCRKIDIYEHRSTTEAPSTTPMATTATGAAKEASELLPNKNGGSAIAVVTLPLLLTQALVVLL